MKTPPAIDEIKRRTEAIERQTRAYEKSNEVLVCRVDIMEEAMDMLEKGMALMGVALCATKVKEANAKSSENGARIGTLETSMKGVREWAAQVREEKEKTDRKLERIEAMTKGTA